MRDRKRGRIDEEIEKKKKTESRIRDKKTAEEEAK